MPLYKVKCTYYDSVSASNTVSKNSTDFAVGGPILTKDFEIPSDGTYEITVSYQWRHDRRDAIHRVETRIDSVEIEALRCRQYSGGQNLTSSDIRVPSTMITEVQLTAGTYTIDMRYSTGTDGRTAYVFNRMIQVRKI